jgi:hypothetical protein
LLPFCFVFVFSQLPKFYRAAMDLVDSPALSALTLKLRAADVKSLSASSSSSSSSVALPSRRVIMQNQQQTQKKQGDAFAMLETQLRQTDDELLATVDQLEDEAAPLTPKGLIQVWMSHL